MSARRYGPRDVRKPSCASPTLQKRQSAATGDQRRNLCRWPARRLASPRRALAHLLQGFAHPWGRYRSIVWATAVACEAAQTHRAQPLGKAASSHHAASLLILSCVVSISACEVIHHGFLHVNQVGIILCISCRGKLYAGWICEVV